VRQFALHQFVELFTHVAKGFLQLPLRPPRAESNGLTHIKMVGHPSALSRATNWTFKKARNLYCGAGQTTDWEALAGTVRNAHSRKRGFLAVFEQIATGKSQRPSSFAEHAQEQWKRLTA
jgi:hypothetical protein